MMASKDQLPAAGAARAERIIEWRADRPTGGVGYLRGRGESVAALASPIFFLLLWQVAATWNWIDARFFPAPWSIIQEFGIQITQGPWLTDVAISLKRILIGFILGAVPGVVIGIAMGLVPIIRAAVQPIVNATYPIPKIAILPLFILIFGLGEGSKYAVIAVAVVYIVLINTFEGVRNIDKIYFDVGKNYYASRLMMFRDVALIGALPNILAGLKLGMGIGLLVIVAAEFSGAHSGIGYMIWNAWQTFQVKQMYVGLVTTAMLGFAFSTLFDWMNKRLLPWKRRTP